MEAPDVIPPWEPWEPWRHARGRWSGQPDFWVVVKKHRDRRRSEIRDRIWVERTPEADDVVVAGPFLGHAAARQCASAPETVRKAYETVLVHEVMES